MIFTSAGENTHFLEWWVSKEQMYDIYVFYYGENEDLFNKYKSKVTHIEKSKGSKFQNFYKFYTKNPDIIQRYDYFFLLDDDIEIKHTNINKMFFIAEMYKLHICAPSFTSKSKISWPHTLHKPHVFLSYTNFIEVNAPLYSKNALKALMKCYDPRLIGWGIDYLATWANGLYKQSSYAIIHSIQCTNPKESEKKNKKRELFKISNSEHREKTWNEYANEIGCPRRFKILTYTTLYKK